MTRRKSLALTVLLVACAGQSLNVGNDSSGNDSGTHSEGATSAVGGISVGTGGTGPSGGGTTGANPPPNVTDPEWPAQTGCATDPAAQDLVGTWQGQLEDFYLQRLKSLTLVVNGASSRGMCGSLKWGDAEAPPPATDPSAPYPSSSIYDTTGYGGAPSFVPYDGFTYTIAQGAVRDRAVRLSIGTRELFASWCALQTPYPADGGYRCVPDTTNGYSFGAGPDGICQIGNRSFSSFACYICIGNACVCDEQSCRAGGANGDFEIALTLSEDRKSMTGPAAPNANGGYQDGMAYYLEHVK